MKGSRERGSFKILPTNGARVYKPISLDRRQIGLIMEEGQIVYHGNEKERVVTFGNQEYVLYCYCNTTLQVGERYTLTLQICLRIC